MKLSKVQTHVQKTNACKPPWIYQKVYSVYVDVVFSVFSPFPTFL